MLPGDSFDTAPHLWPRFAKPASLHSPRVSLPGPVAPRSAGASPRTGVGSGDSPPGTVSSSARVLPTARLSVSNSLSGRHWELDQVPAVGDLTDIVQLGTGHHVSVGEGQRRVALQRRVAAYLVGGGQTPRNVASILDSARELGIRDAQALLHESSLARTMPIDKILTCRCDTTLVVRGRSSDSGSHSRGRPHFPAGLDSGTPPTTRSRSTRLRVRGVRPSWFHPPRRPPLRGICSINTSHSRAPCIKTSDPRFGPVRGPSRIQSCQTSRRDTAYDDSNRGAP